MDLALLAATALGLVGVFLMLPREQATLVKIGALLGTLGLAGLFLYLVRLAPTPAGAPPIPFYLFAGIMIAGSVGVICHPKPVYAALYFVLVTLAGAGLFVLLMAEFMAIVLVIVYAGAILVTYVFVIMLASQGRKATGGAADYDRMASEPLAAVLVSFILLGTILQVMLPTGTKTIVQRNASQTDQMMAAHLGVSQPAGPAGAPAPKPSNIQVLGSTLYGNYTYSLELAGVLLTIALVGAVVIARKNVEGPATIGSGEVPTE